VIIEGAFFKLPEVLIQNRTPGDHYEGTLVSQLAMAVLLELNARNMPQAIHRIHIERPYPARESERAPGRADLYVNLEDMFPAALHDPFAAYGIRPDNWLEAKLFARIGERAGTETKTSNAAVIALDILRLCLFLPESQWGPSRNARYILLISDRDLAEYVAFSRQAPNPPRREWLSALLSPGTHDPAIAFKEEPRSFRSVIPSQDEAFTADLAISIRSRCVQFAPIAPAGTNSYFGSLIRILGFKIASQGLSLAYDEAEDAIWDDTKDTTQRLLAGKLKGAA
jgi:hypothetical protein